MYVYIAPARVEIINQSINQSWPEGDDYNIVIRCSPTSNTKTVMITQFEDMRYAKL